MGTVNLLRITFLCVIVMRSVNCSTTPNDTDIPQLRLLGLLPTSGVGWIGGRACLTPILMALEDIEARTDLLPDYELNYSWIDSQCNPGVAVYRTTQRIYNDPPYTMLLGDGCSTASESTAQVSYLWNITQVSYGSSSPVLSDRKRFPQFFRLAGSDKTLNNAKIALTQLFNWKRVATINQAEEFFSVVTDDFVKRVKETNTTIISQEIFASDPSTRVENLKHRDARIILTSMYEDKARKMLCAAYKNGLYGSKIVWFFTGWYSSEFWRKSLDDVDCTPAQMDATVEGSLVTNFFFRNPIEQRGIANITASEFDARLPTHWSYNPDFSSFDFVAGQCYDHIWVAAMALDCADKTLRAMGHHKALHEFTYEDADINQMIFECVGNTSMKGVAGNVEFQNNGPDPIKKVKIEQIQDGKRTTVAIYRMDKTPSVFEWMGKGIQWKDGNVPRDSTYIIKKEVTIPLSVYIPMSTCSAIGILLALGLFGFNVFHRNNPTVKLSSPNINNVMLLGCIMCYTTVFLKPTETDNSYVCKTRTFLFTLGFTIAFGALFSKTWRVYRIFTNKKLLRMTIKDYQLLAIICGLVVVVFIVLVTWEIIGPQVMVIKSLDKEIYKMGNDEEVHPFVRVCYSDMAGYFSWVLYVIEGTLLSFGAFLAWETRYVKIEALNDSHQIGLCLYNVVVLSAVGLTLSLALDQQIIILYGMTSGCLIIGTTVIQVVVFVPKVLAVYQKNSVADMNGTGATRTITTMPTSSGPIKSTQNTLTTNP